MTALVHTNNSSLDLFIFPPVPAQQGNSTHHPVQVRWEKGTLTIVKNQHTTEHELHQRHFPENGKPVVYQI